MAGLKGCGWGLKCPQNVTVFTERVRHNEVTVELLDGPSSNTTGVLTRKGNWETDTHREKAVWGHREKMSTGQGQKLQEKPMLWTLVSDLWPPAWDNSSCCVSPPPKSWGLGSCSTSKLVQFAFVLRALGSEEF